MDILQHARLVFLGSSRGFRARLVSTRFGINLEHLGEAPSAEEALLLAVAHMAKVNTSPEYAVKLLRAVADKLESV